MLELKEEYRVHVSTVGSKDTLLAIAPSNRNAPTHTLRNSLTGVQKIMKVTLAPLQLIPSTNN